MLRMDADTELLSCSLVEQVPLRYTGVLGLPVCSVDPDGHSHMRWRLGELHVHRAGGQFCQTADSCLLLMLVL